MSTPDKKNMLICQFTLFTSLPIYAYSIVFESQMKYSGHCSPKSFINLNVNEISEMEGQNNQCKLETVSYTFYWQICDICPIYIFLTITFLQSAKQVSHELWS